MLPHKSLCRSPLTDPGSRAHLKKKDPNSKYVPLTLFWKKNKRKLKYFEIKDTGDMFLEIMET